MDMRFNRPAIFLAVICVMVFASSFLAKAMLLGEPSLSTTQPGDYGRIVSTAPSLTELLFALGLGDRVAGVTRYCRFPLEARSKPQIGGHFDPNFEAIVALRPDLVVLLEGEASQQSTFEKLGLRTLTVCHKSVESFLDSIETIGHVCCCELQAERVSRQLRTRIESIRRKTEHLSRPRVMIAVDRIKGTGQLENVYIAGSDGHLDHIIALAGGENAYRQGIVRFPIVSSESIVQINPEVIIDLVNQRSAADLGTESILADWQSVSQVEAVRNNRVYVLADDRALLPGLGFVRLAEQLVRRIHPEVELDERPSPDDLRPTETTPEK